MAGVRRWSALLVPPVAFGALFLLAWQALVRGLDIKSYVLSAPTDIWSQARHYSHSILTAAGHSGLNALIGLVVGTLVGVLLAAACSRIVVLGHALTPLVAALAAIPIVCLAPLLNNMYSLDSALPRRIVVAIAAFVPVFINTLRGLQQISPIHAELMASYAATKTQILSTIRIPGALPHFFTGLRVAASVAVIAAVVSEYFGGLQDGLGSRITRNVASTNYPAAWASVLGAVILGLLFFIGATLLERLVLGRRAAALSQT